MKLIVRIVLIESILAVLHAAQYSDKLDELIYEDLRLFDLSVRRKTRPAQTQ